LDAGCDFSPVRLTVVLYDDIVVAAQAAMEDDLCQLEAGLITPVVAAPDKLGCQIVRCIEVAHCAKAS
jgi:predicted hydrocarbon binding protein